MLILKVKYGNKSEISNSNSELKTNFVDRIYKINMKPQKNNFKEDRKSSFCHLI